MGTRSQHQLIEAGLRLLDQAGPHTLQARTVTQEAGASTMAVYTHFGGMTGLVDAIANEAFARFARAVAAVDKTTDPVADFFSIGAAYRRFALQNPQRYKFFFNAASPNPHSRNASADSVQAIPTGYVGSIGPFDALVHTVRRMMTAGRIRDDDARKAADRLWLLIHGFVMLQIAGFFAQTDGAYADILQPLTIDILVGMGDDRDRALRSARRAAQAAM